MRIVRSVDEMRRLRPTLEGPVSMMATLGAMHAGHEALIRHARTCSTSLVGSLFLNPTQFNDTRDLDAYPVQTERDLALFESLGADVVFTPSPREVYPAGDDLTIDPGSVASKLEGAHRPGHFRGVATVVAKLLSVIRPDIAVWGAKDAQQNAVIRSVTRGLLMNVDHHIRPTVREDDGLALSSRNARLSVEERRAAPVLFESLSTVGRLFGAGEVSTLRLLAGARDVLSREPALTVEYVSVVDPASFEDVEIAEPGAVVCLAATLGETRLIDNLVLGASGESRIP